VSAVVAGSEARRAPGRPRDEQASEEILDAAVALLTEQGFAGVTVDAVARRAGVSKATIYRRWPTKEALLLAAAHCLSGGPPEVPDTGTVGDDLRLLLRSFIDVLAGGLPGEILPELVAESTRRPEIRALLAQFAAERRRRWNAVLERAEARGELRVGLDREVVIDCLTGPLFTRLLVTGRPLTPVLADEIVDAVLPGILATPR